MLITGVFWGTWFTLTRTFEVFSAPEFIHIGKVIIHNVAEPMRIIMPAGIILNLLSIWFYPDKNSSNFYLAILACVFFIIALLITLKVLVPYDNEIKVWTSETLPSNWENIRMNWKTFHTLRTFSSLTGFACFSWVVINTIITNKKKA